MGGLAMKQGVSASSWPRLGRTVSVKPPLPSCDLKVPVNYDAAASGPIGSNWELHQGPAESVGVEPAETEV
jgi:hypothetical protein